jgi:hypothetical protein
VVAIGSGAATTATREHVQINVEGLAHVSIVRHPVQTANTPAIGHMLLHDLGSDAKLVTGKRQTGVAHRVATAQGGKKNMKGAPKEVVSE